jgi:hypothetical protein
MDGPAPRRGLRVAEVDGLPPRLRGSQKNIQRIAGWSPLPGRFAPWPDANEAWACIAFLIGFSASNGWERPYADARRGLGSQAPRSEMNAPAETLDQPGRERKNMVTQFERPGRIRR